MKRLIYKILYFLALNILPKTNSLRKHALYLKYLAHLQIKGNNCTIDNPIHFSRNNTLNLGNNVNLKGGGRFDAQAGIMLGDDVTIEENVDLITSYKSASDILTFEPIIIDRNQTVNAGTRIMPGSIISDNLKGGLLDYNGQILFIVSTGRSGSKSVAQMINKSDEAECFHDAFAHINVWTCDRLYKRKTDNDIYNKLKVLYGATNQYNKYVHGQSDQKLGGLIPVIYKLFPKAKFIWLIRDAKSFINSSYPRGWYYNSEFGYSENKKEFYTALAKPSKFHATHRISGELTGHLSTDNWVKMTAFERNCWYWTYWNELIEKDLVQIPSHQWIQIKLNDLSQKTEVLTRFIGLNKKLQEPLIINKANYRKMKTNDWNEEMQVIYNYHCKQSMEKWF